MAKLIMGIAITIWFFVPRIKPILEDWALMVQ